MLAEIIENSKLKIIDHNIHRLTKLDFHNRVLNCYSVSYMKTGCSLLRIFGEEYHAMEGDALIIPPHIVHDHVKEDSNDACFMWWNFTYKIHGIIDFMRVLDLPVLFRIRERERFEQSVFKYRESSLQMNKLSDYILQEARAFEMAAILLEMVLDQSSHKTLADVHNDVFVSMLASIMRNADKNNLMGILAEEYSMHPNYIRNRFRKLYGVTPTQFQRQLRLKKAQEMLLGDIRCNVSEVAIKLGYENIADFSRFFKSCSGVSPLEYRKAHTINITEGI
ncbi:MAG: AraC family transcriptional regulator [Defluviitaleaceae bacterium]|nr:AraC family transcriptional regulator [Defluviitaleaceae bacterium]